MPRAVQIAVCGPRHCTEQDKEHAFEVGRLLAEHGAILINGGGIGVMASSTAGAKSAGGLVIGVRPGNSGDDANPDLDAVVVTGMGEARNNIIISSAAAVIVVGGSWGTLSELALARRRGVPVISLGGWQLLDAEGNPVPDAPDVAASPLAAVKFALSTSARS